MHPVMLPKKGKLTERSSDGRVFQVALRNCLGGGLLGGGKLKRSNFEH